MNFSRCYRGAFDPNIINIILSVYHRYLAALSFNGMYDEKYYLGCIHFLINKLVRTLYMSASALDHVNLQQLCTMICHNRDIVMCSSMYSPKNENEKMDIIEIIQQQKPEELKDYLEKWKASGK